MTRVVCCELAPQVGQFNRNLAAAANAIDAAVGAGADLIVLPELATSGYCFDSIEEVHASALRADDAAFRSWCRAAGDAVVVAGFAEAGSAGAVHNSAIVLDRTGVRAVYRKVHLWDTEKRWFTPGDAPAPVIDTVHGRVGVLVCYDLEFPEMSRSVALRGADVLAVPTNWPWVDRPDGMPAPEVVIAMAAARVNRLPIACCDRRGEERGQRWNEATTIIGPDGWPVAVATESGCATAELDLTTARQKAISPRNDVFGDRRPDVY